MNVGKGAEEGGDNTVYSHVLHVERGQRKQRNTFIKV